MSERMIARLIFCAGLISLFFAFPSCREQEPLDLFRIAVPYEIATLDPHAEDKLANFGVLLNLYETLVLADADMVLRPALSVAWENPNPQTWIFRLRSDVMFHSGKSFDSADVVFSLNRVLGSTNLEVRTYLADVVEVTAMGVHRVRIKTRRPCPLLLGKLANIMIIPEGSTRDALAREANGTGPYRFTSWSIGKSVLLSRHDGYSGNRPTLPNVEYMLGNSPQDALAGLLANRFHLAQIDSVQARRAQVSTEYRVERQDNMYVKHLGFDLTSRQPQLTTSLSHSSWIRISMQSMHPSAGDHAPTATSSPRRLVEMDSERILLGYNSFFG